MTETLFLAHRMPFPPDRGDKIRSHHILKALAAMGPVHVGCFTETAADRAELPTLAALAASHCAPQRRKPLPLAGVEAVARGLPVSLTAFHHRGLADWVSETLATRAIDTLVVFSGQMGQYVPAGFAGRLIVDLCDVDSAKFGAYAAAGQRRWINAREARLLAAEEERLAQRADATLLISEAEAALLHSRLRDPSAARLAVMGNGIDTAFFDPAEVTAHPALREGGPHCVFTGQMDYAPNVDAAFWAAGSLMPRVRETWPEAQFHIVGRAPTAVLRALDGHGGVRVWGEVPDVRPFLAGADAVLAPLAIARGVQNKVLEAMAMARPVVLTPEAATGLPGEPQAALRIAPREAAAMAAALDALFADRAGAAALGRAARAHVLAHGSWDAALAPLRTLAGAG